MTIHHRPFPALPAATPIARMIADGADLYRRQTVLPRLLPVAPQDLAPDDAAVARELCVRLARALRQERARGRAGHWSYSLDRHIGLAQAFRAERAHLASLQAGAKKKGVT